MKPADAANVELLKSLARRAMLERGLLPEFSVAAMNQTNAIEGPAEASGAGIRELRSVFREANLQVDPAAGTGI
jgi:hypothetical protein